jgi:mannose/fructose/N-acetylgalactosamine-specific phosphotransferase system component IID
MKTDMSPRNPQNDELSEEQIVEIVKRLWEDHEKTIEKMSNAIGLHIITRVIGEDVSVDSDFAFTESKLKQFLVEIQDIEAAHKKILEIIRPKPVDH